MYPLRLTILHMICVLYVGSGWANPARLESAQASSSTVSTRASSSKSVPGIETSSAGPIKTIASTVIASSTQSRSGISSDDSTTSPLSTGQSKSTRRTTTINAVTQTHTVTFSSSTLHSTSVTSTLQSDMNVTTSDSSTTTNFTTSSIHPTSLSTTTPLLNWTFPGPISPESDSTSAPGHCAVGSDCAQKLGVGLGFGCTFAVIILFFITRKYRKHLHASHQEHQYNWNNRGNLSNGFQFSQEDQGAVKMLDTSDITRTTSPHNGRVDELHLPEDVQRVVDRVAEMQQQESLLRVEAYGSIRRKPLPNYWYGS